jgi:hypothetical protein
MHTKRFDLALVKFSPLLYLLDSNLLWIHAYCRFTIEKGKLKSIKCKVSNVHVFPYMLCDHFCTIESVLFLYTGILNSARLCCRFIQISSHSSSTAILALILASFPGLPGPATSRLCSVIVAHAGQLKAGKAWSETSREVDVGLDVWGEWHLLT